MARNIYTKEYVDEIHENSLVLDCKSKAFPIKIMLNSDTNSNVNINDLLQERIDSENLDLKVTPRKDHKIERPEYRLYCSDWFGENESRGIFMYIDIDNKAFNGTIYIDNIDMLDYFSHIIDTDTTPPKNRDKRNFETVDYSSLGSKKTIDHILALYYKIKDKMSFKDYFNSLYFS